MSRKTPRKASGREDGGAGGGLRPEYRFDYRRARLNRFAAAFEGRTVVLLDADVAATFPDAAAVNEALRALSKIAARQSRKRSARRRTA